MPLNQNQAHWIQIDYGSLVQGAYVEILRQFDSSQAPNQIKIALAKNLSTWASEIQSNAAILTNPIASVDEPYGTSLLRYKIPYKQYFRYLRVYGMRVNADPTSQIISIQYVGVSNT